MSILIDEINDQIEKYSLLKHEFYQMWQKGQLSMDHLAGYSKEYFQLVKTVPILIENILKNNQNDKYTSIIKSNLDDEREHLKPWINFSSYVGVKEEDLINFKSEELTNEAIDELIKLSESSFEEGIAALYAFEKEIPKISDTKLIGLNQFYGIKDHKAQEYFDIHKEVDIYHSKVWEKILDELPYEMRDKIINSSILSLKAQNKLLDSVKNKYVGNTIAC